MAGNMNSTRRSLRSNTIIPSEELSVQQLLNNIRRVILESKDQGLTFSDIPSAAGLQLATSFSKIQTSKGLFLESEWPCQRFYTRERDYRRLQR
ncbi:hypothetical protein RJZ57_003845 [Blastomyces gilchristii]